MSEEIREGSSFDLQKDLFEPVQGYPQGSAYRIANIETSYQFITFVNKEEDMSGKFVTTVDGTTNEAVLGMLIHRLGIQHSKLQSKESSEAISHLNEALALLKLRTTRRKEQGVENTNKPHQEELNK